MKKGKKAQMPMPGMGSMMSKPPMKPMMGGMGGGMGGSPVKPKPVMKAKGTPLGAFAPKKGKKKGKKSSFPPAPY